MYFFIVNHIGNNDQIIWKYLDQIKVNQLKWKKEEKVVKSTKIKIKLIQIKSIKPTKKVIKLNQREYKK